KLGDATKCFYGDFVRSLQCQTGCGKSGYAFGKRYEQVRTFEANAGNSRLRFVRAPRRLFVRLLHVLVGQGDRIGFCDKIRPDGPSRAGACGTLPSSGARTGRLKIGQRFGEGFSWPTTKHGSAEEVDVRAVR